MRVTVPRVKKIDSERGSTVDYIFALEPDTKEDELFLAFLNFPRLSLRPIIENVQESKKLTIEAQATTMLETPEGTIAHMIATLPWNIDNYDKKFDEVVAELERSRKR